MARVAAIVLAAGAGRRIGLPKALLPFGPGRTAVQRIVELHHAAGISDVWVVTGSAEEAVRRSAAAVGARTIYNPHHENGGQTSSLKLALTALEPEVDGFAIHPVDHLFVTLNDLLRLVQAFSGAPQRRSAILRPAEGDSFGHPVIFGAAYRGEFAALSDDTPGSTVYRRHRDRVQAVSVENPWIGRDVDLRADVERLRRATGYLRAERVPPSWLDFHELEPTDLAEITAQLGRTPRGACEVVARCHGGHPQVARVRPLLLEGERLVPFPSTYWLTCRRTQEALARLEAAQVVGRLEDRLTRDPDLMRRCLDDHELSAKERARELESDPLGALAPASLLEGLLSRGLGGIRDRRTIKCLHLHYAHHRARGGAIGRILEEEYGIQPCED